MFSFFFLFQKRDKQWPLWLPRKQYGEGYADILTKNPKIKVVGKLLNWMGGKYKRVKILAIETLDLTIRSLNWYINIVEFPYALYKENNLQVKVWQF